MNRFFRGFGIFPIGLLIILLSPTFVGADSPIRLTIKTFPAETELYAGSRLLEPERSYTLTEGKPCGHFREYLFPESPTILTLAAEGFRPKILRLENPAHTDGSLPLTASDAAVIDIYREEKLEPFGTGLRFLNYAATGEQPKSVETFQKTSDAEALQPGTYTELAAVALLRGRGVQFYNSRTGEPVKYVEIPEPHGSRLGFVETVFLPEREELWVSQMEGGLVHIISTKDLSYTASVPSGGRWTKILTASPDGKTIYASNWLSQNLGVIDAETRNLEKTIPLSGIPRGSAFTPDGDFLYVCIFDTGNIEKIHVPSGRSVKVIETGPGASRHILYDPNRNLFYISDMYHGTVYALDPRTDRVASRRLRVGPNLNTIKLSADGRFLFVSSRGRNNPETYLIEGAEYGTVSVVDTESFQIVDRIYGGDQPTGLALSGDGRRLIFSDFLDRRLEFYDIEAITGRSENGEH